MKGLLNQFDLGEGLERVWLGNVARLTPDKVMRSWWIGDEEARRLVHVLETDFITGLDDVRDSLKQILGYTPELIKVREPLQDFSQAALHKYTEVYKQPEDYDQVRLYMNELYNTQPFYISFAAWGKVDDKIIIKSTNF